jgi:hypothetical protein
LENNSHESEKKNYRQPQMVVMVIPGQTGRLTVGRNLGLVLS